MKRSHVLFAALLVLGPRAVALNAQTIGTAQSDSLAATNGNKIAVGASSRLHAVYVNNNSIYYSSSANSQSWTVGAPISTSSEQPALEPTIAVASDGTLGVVYRSGVGLWYRSCKPALNAPCSSWSNPFPVGNGTHPSLTAFKTTMYLVSASGGILNYAQIAASSGSVSNMEYVYYSSSGCQVDTVNFPAVTVIPVAGAVAPEIRVSWLQTSLNSNCKGIPDLLIVRSVKRKSTYPPWSIGGGDLTYSLPVTSSLAQMHSLSAAANGNTGEQFLAASFMTNNNHQTLIFRRDQAGNWLNASVIDQRSLIDIESNGSPCNPQIRIAFTNPGSGSYGNTLVLTGSWTGALPVWSGGIWVDTAGSSPQASFWASPLYQGPGLGNYGYVVPVFYAHSLGAGVESVQLQSFKTGGLSATDPGCLSTI